MAKKQFKAESKRLLDMMIHSIYTHKEIFLRELISNASDAIDKRYYAAMQNGGEGMDRSDYFIRLTPSESTRTLTITDNGCGMTEKELEEDLGTIAKSGTLAFKQAMDKPDADVDVIGQFGVGFYSAFMVAKNIKVYSRTEDGEGHVWESDGQDGYTVKPFDFPTVGTQIVLTLKDDEEGEDYSQYLREYMLKSLVKKYSDYVRYPIRMMEEKRVPKGEKEEGKPQEYETVMEDVVLNSMVPLWKRSKGEVTEEEYNQFYRDNFFDVDDPLTTIRVSVEGAVSYTALLFIPKKAPWDFYTKGYKRGLKLYSSGVMIMDAYEDLLPDYFGFVKGLVDSPDLSLNISREMLQHDRQLKAIANNLKKKIQSELKKMLDSDREKYETFYKAFSQSIKFGVYDQYGMNADFLKDLLMYWSAGEEKNVTLHEYVAKMKEDQKAIYYAAGDSLAHCLGLPQAELIRDKGYDLLCLTDDVDEFAVRVLASYEEKPFKAATDDDLGLASDEEKKAIAEKAEESKDLLEKLKEDLAGKVKEVKLSDRLTKSVACLNGEGGVSIEMYKVLKAMPNAGDIPMEFVLELNPEHPVFQKLSVLSDADRKEYAELLYQQARLMAGLPLEDPAAFSELICKLM